ncbi:MAG: class I SAM-dependent methyltransferase [Desulfobacterales bacterium]|nr:class I SAM-dependent methyltransferase [Desulfobacterales bacterium]
MKCSECGQLFFIGDETYYSDSISKFDAYCGTCPEQKISKRMLARTLKTIRRVEQLLGKKRTALRALDVGCSSGGLIRTLESIGVEAQGVEPMPKPAQAASDYGFTVYQGYLEELGLPENTYNLITLFEVIEHLRNPVALLSECRRLLEPKGVLVIRTGNADSWTVRFMKEKWDYFSPWVGHISFFNPRSMRLLAERTGFRLEKINYHSVSLFKKEDVSPALFRAGKILAELLNFPSKMAGKSHEIEVYLRAG